jgi:hypothetical protein
LLLVVAREHDYAHVREGVLDLLRRLDAVLVGHDDVHDHDVREDVLYEGEDLGPVGCLSDHLDPALGLEHRPYPATKKVVIIDENNSNKWVHHRKMIGRKPEHRSGHADGRAVRGRYGQGVE